MGQSMGTNVDGIFIQVICVISGLLSTKLRSRRSLVGWRNDPSRDSSRSGVQGGRRWYREEGGGNSVSSKARWTSCRLVLNQLPADEAMVMLT